MLENRFSPQTKAKVQRLSDEELLQTISSASAGHHRDWIKLSEIELRARGFVLDRTDTRLTVLTPEGLKLTYRNAGKLSLLGNDGSQAPESESPTVGWTPIRIVLLVVAALVSIIATAIVFLLIAQIPEDTLEWVGPTTLAILTISLFIGLWRTTFLRLSRHFDH